MYKRACGVWGHVRKNSHKAGKETLPSVDHAEIDVDVELKRSPFHRTSRAHICVVYI